MDDIWTPVKLNVIADHMTPDSVTTAAEDQRDAYHHGDLRRALLDAMRDVVERDGIEAVSLRGLARTVGVAPSAAFRHFRDKRALVTTFSYEALGDMIALAERMQADQPDAAGRFEAIGRAYIRFASEQPHRFRAMNRRELVDTDDPVWRAMGERMDALVFETLQGVDAAADEGTQAARGLLAWAAVHGLVTLALDGWVEDADPEDPLSSPQVADAFALLAGLVTPR